MNTHIPCDPNSTPRYTCKEFTHIHIPEHMLNNHHIKRVHDKINTEHLIFPTIEYIKVFSHNEISSMQQ